MNIGVLDIRRLVQQYGPGERILYNRILHYSFSLENINIYILI